MYHISDLKKYNRCPRMYLLDQEAERQTYTQFIRMDEEVTVLAAQKLGVKDCFIGQRGDEKEKALLALGEKEWLLKARFEYDGLRVKVPFLHRTAEGWELYFLFTGLYPQANDLQFYCDTVWVVENNGIVLSDIHVIHLNGDYVRGKELDVDQLFIVSDCFYNAKNNPSAKVKDAIRKHMTDVSETIRAMENCTVENMPEPVRKGRCSGRQKCRFYEDCFPGETEQPYNSILTLNSSQYRYDMQKEGIEWLRDADPKRIEGSRQQYAQIRADQLGGLFVDRKALQSWMEDIQYPLTFIDFEWERYAIPPYEGMKPYDVLPFEYSVHILQEDGTITHTVFLAVHDDRRELAEGLLRDIPKEGSVMAYNAIGAEVIRIRELAEQFPEYAGELLNINARMKDMQIPFEDGVIYDTRMHGLWSLKVIMGMMDDPGYSNLDIAHGMDAVYQWRQLDRNDPNANTEEIIEGLKAYCGMDTYAMTVVYKWMQNLLKEPAAE